ncbi:MAG TPA: class II aldolase/adducin family protein [Candidatus Binataceae bacterium]|nr:class II aldolase/adducin family protein [Candidatus Binataceae bacterium]
MLIEELISAGKELYERGLQTPRSGNISARDAKFFWITRTGTNLARLTEAQFVRVDVDSRAVIPAEASVECSVHRGVYNATAARAIIHAHPPYAIAAAETVGEEGITPVHNEALVGLKWIPVIHTSVAGEDTGEDAAGIAAPLSRWPAVVIRGHGAFTIGGDIDEALYKMLLLEEVCKINCILRSIR